MAKFIDVGSIGAFFETLPDPRHTRNRKHLLVDVIVICVCAILCNCDGPTAIHRWALARREWLATLLALPKGIPSRDCLRRVLLALKPEAFQRCFLAWIATAVVDAQDHPPPQRLIAIDGKTCRGAREAAKNLGALHLVSAWDSGEGLALGQVATDAKSNEITAIPVLLEQLDLTNATVTLDAMGCQKTIVEQIVDDGGDFVITLKDNQRALLSAVRGIFAAQIARDFEDMRYRRYETSEDGHGRHEERTYYLVKTPRDFAVAEEWPQVKALG